MKKVKKYLAMIIAMIMVLGMSMVVFAGTITVKNATKGYTYEAYKVFDATYSGEKVSYKTSADNKSKLDSSLFGWSTAADSDGNISVWKSDSASDADVIQWMKDNYQKFGGTAIPGVFDAADSTVSFKDLAPGYYYITSGLGAAVTIDTATGSDATVYDKNETTPVDPAKVIVSVDGAAKSDVASADAHVGSIVGFRLSGSTNNWIDKDTIRTAWEITDTPTNMAIDADTVTVKYNGTALADDAYTKTVDESTGALTIKVPMTDSKGNSIYPANLGTTAGLIPIEITYSAAITKEAGDSPAKNQIPGSSTEVDTYAFKIKKTDGSAPLPGAQFELHTGSNALRFDDNGDGTYTYNADGDVTTLDMTTNTTITVKGLDNSWEYTLKETKVPDGYNQAPDETIAGSDLTKVNADITTLELYEAEVVNKAGIPLPSTGGIGTTIFYVVGTVLVIGAGILMVTRRRMNGK